MTTTKLRNARELAQFGLWRDYITAQRKALTAKIAGDVEKEQRYTREANLLSLYLKR